MGYFDAFIIGIIQGLTEYLPISSSAHLILTPKFMGQGDPGLTFDVFLHIGTLLSTLIYFHKDWKNLLIGSKDAVISLKGIIVATIPALIFGAAFHSIIKSELRGVGVLVVTLSFFGVLLYLTDRVMPQNRGIKKLSVKELLVVGCFQCLALIPGTSRSGITITGARFLRLDRADAARLSFLMSGPVTAAAIVFELRHWRELLETTVSIGPLTLAVVSSFVFGMIAIGGLLTLVKRFSFLSFAVYRLLLAFAIWQIIGL